ncbi:OmpA family protein [Ideonella azotifigens]|uniref:OmpA-like domain-containing protein n=1 Tax=Ideonella azotifigens TaxID=513160 RepID=A0ABN1K0I7_9BURK|nr:OmpA family protein [Ideonella azotifigens]MCD2341542.1 OmpA family protein [Ideonella azotifigens]
MSCPLLKPRRGAHPSPAHALTGHLASTSLALTLLLGACEQAAAQAGAAALPAASAPSVATTSAANGKVVVAGVVPDEATRAAILASVRELYGADRVVDQLGVDKLVAPPNWTAHVQRVLSPELKKVSGGQLRIVGNVVELSGQVDGEAARQQLLSQVATQLNNPTYSVRDGLTVPAVGQKSLDDVLARRTIAFEVGNAHITPAGVAVLEELLPLMKQMAGRRFEIVGHTDDIGLREANVALSEARAKAVKDYLVAKGIAAADIVTSGAGPDRPVADNLSPAGRARNRRIEFRVLA